MCQHLFLISFISHTRYPLHILNSSNSRVWKNKWVMNWHVIHDTIARWLVITTWPTREDLRRSNDQLLCYFFTKQEALLWLSGIFDNSLTHNGPLATEQFTICMRNLYGKEQCWNWSNLDRSLFAIQRSPGKSCRKAVAQLGIFRCSVQWILKSDLHMYPFKMTSVHKLSDEHKRQGLLFARWAEDKEQTLNNVWFSDEAHFYVI